MTITPKNDDIGLFGIPGITVCRRDKYGLQNRFKIIFVDADFKFWA